MGINGEKSESSRKLGKSFEKRLTKFFEEIDFLIREIEYTKHVPIEFIMILLNHSVYIYHITVLALSFVSVIFCFGRSLILIELMVIFIIKKA